MRSAEAIVKPELLRWARDSSGLSVEAAAKKVQVKAERLRSWETGESRPTIKQLRKLGRAYKRPIAVFYLSEAPKDFQAMHDFRRLPGEFDTKESPELRLAIRQARYRREVALELFESLGEQAPRFDLSASLDDDPEATAATARDALGVTFEEQKRWKGRYGALNGWRSVVESLGVLVFQASGVSVDEMRGFSLSERPLPAITLNSKDSPRGRLFTLMHELTHLMLHREGICDLVEAPGRSPADQRIEVFCNHVAGAVLVPDDLLLSQPEVEEQDPTEEWTPDQLARLISTFGVSEEVILRRLLILGRTTHAFYRARRAELESRYERIRAPSGAPPPDVLSVSRSGRLFAGLVLGAYRQGKITSRDLSDYLEIRLKHLPKVEERVLGSAA